MKWLVLTLGFAGCASAEPAWYLRALPLQMRSAQIQIQGQAHRTLSYGLIQSRRCAQRRDCPLLIVLPPGAQNKNLMQEGLRPWAKDFLDHDWVVVSPVAPSAQERFFERGVALLPAFAEHAVANYSPRRKPVLMGMSNGGISALMLATMRPALFERILVAPGYLPPESRKAAPRIQSRVKMVVGANDRWLAPSRQTAQTLGQIGVSVHLQELPGVGHNLMHALTWESLEQALAR